MGVYLSKPNTYKMSKNHNSDIADGDNPGFSISCGSCSMQGWRLENEDAHTVGRFSPKYSYFGVFDGHGGKECAVYAAEHIPVIISESDDFKAGQLEKAMEKAFLTIDDQIRQEDVREVLLDLGDMPSKSDISEKELQDLKNEGEGELDEDADERKKKVLKAMLLKSLGNHAENFDDDSEEDSDEDYIYDENKNTDGDQSDDPEDNDGDANESKSEDDDGDSDNNDDGKEDDEDDEDDDFEGEDLDIPDSENNYEGPEGPGYESGTTALFTVLDHDSNTLFIANAGDCRAVISERGVAVDLTVDHKPEDELELKRIEKAGGMVTKQGRVNGNLNLSRAIGDHRYKQTDGLDLASQMITSFPDTYRRHLSKDDDYMVIACDGIWNSFSSQEVVDFCSARIEKGIELSKICEELFDKILPEDKEGDGTGLDNM